MCLRAAVTAIFIVFHVGSGAVAAFGVCCQHENASTGPTMECCEKGGSNHICPFMSKRTRTKVPGGELKGPCSAGHDDGVPVSGFGAPPLQRIRVPLPSINVICVSVDALEPVGRALHPPAPPPKA